MILVTGGTGLLGSYLVEALLRDNQSVKVLIRKEEDRSLFTSSEDLSFAMGDVLDIPSLEEAFDGVEQVYHCAGYISFHPRDKAKLSQINVIGTANIVNMCLANDVRLCHVSSVAAIGKSKGAHVITEENQWENSSDNSYYGYTKYLGELEVWRGIEEGLNAVIVNPSVILGYARWSSPSMKLFKYVKDGAKYYTEGGNNFVDVKDVVGIMISLMQNNISGERFIIAGSRYSYKNLFDEIAGSLNVKAPNTLATAFTLKIGYWLGTFISWFNGKPSIITKETIKVGKRTHEYSSQKVIELLAYQFSPLDQTIAWIGDKINEQK